MNIRLIEYVTVEDAKPLHCNEYELQIEWMLGDGDEYRTTHTFFSIESKQQMINMANWMLTHDLSEYAFFEIPLHLKETFNTINNMIGIPNGKHCDTFFEVEGVEIHYYNESGVKVTADLTWST